MDFYACCSRLTDFELCDAIASELEVTHGHPPVPAAMPHEHAVVYMVWSYGGFMDVNGFIYGLSRLENGLDDVKFLSQAYLTIDDKGMAELFDAVAAALPEGAVPTDETDSLRAKLSATTLGDDEALETLYFRYASGVQAKMGQYVRGRIDAFSMLDVAKYV